MLPWQSAFHSQCWPPYFLIVFPQKTEFPEGRRSSPLSAWSTADANEWTVVRSLGLGIFLWVSLGNKQVKWRNEASNEKMKTWSPWERRKVSGLGHGHFICDFYWKVTPNFLFLWISFLIEWLWASHFFLSLPIQKMRRMGQNMVKYSLAQVYD